MNKHIVADMVTEKLKKEVGIVPRSFPEELRILEAFDYVCLLYPLFTIPLLPSHQGRGNI